MDAVLNRRRNTTMSAKRQSNREPRQTHQSGIVLVIVLWILVLLSLMATSYSTTTRTETRLTAAQVQAVQARGVAEAGVWVAVQQLLQPAAGNPSPPVGIENIPFGAGKFSVHIQDEAGKIDLNSARPELIEGLLKSSGADGPSAVALRDAILDWRDRDYLRRSLGTEDIEYRAAGRGYGAKDGPFNSVEELRQVLGMTETLFQRMRAGLTVYSHQPGVSGQVATSEAVAAIPGATPEIVEHYLEAQRQPVAAGSPVSSFPGLQTRYLSGRRSQTYALTSTGTVSDTKFTLEVIVQLRPGGKPAYAILSWRESHWEGKYVNIETEPGHG